MNTYAYMCLCEYTKCIFMNTSRGRGARGTDVAILCFKLLI